MMEMIYQTLRTAETHIVEAYLSLQALGNIISEAILETSKVRISNSGLADKKHIAIYYVAYIRGVSFLQTTNIS